MLQLGIVDFDSSHSIEFTRRFNHVGVSSDQFVDGARVVAGCPGTSEMSPERIDRHTRQIADCGVEVVESPEQMIGRIDGVLVLSLCGSVHRERVLPFLEARIPAYVDKPFACSIDDADSMIDTARQNDVMLYNASALRYADELADFQAETDRFGPVQGAVTFGPAKRAAGNPGLFHYGIHATEMLFALMGTGCRQVSTTWTDGAEVVTGMWNDGRVGTIRGGRTGSTAYGFTAFCENGVVSRLVSTRNAYRNLCAAVVRSFQNSRPDVENHDSAEVVRFVGASLRSEESGGRPTTVAKTDSR